MVEVAIVEDGRGTVLRSCAVCGTRYTALRRQGSRLAACIIPLAHEPQSTRQAGSQDMQTRLTNDAAKKWLMQGYRPIEEKRDAANPQINDPWKNKKEPRQDEPGQGKPGQGKPNSDKLGQGEPRQGKPRQANASQSRPRQAQARRDKPRQAKIGPSKPSQARPRQGKPSHAHTISPTSYVKAFMRTIQVESA